MPLLQVQLVLEGEGMVITMSSSKSQPQHGKQAVTFRYPSQRFGDPQWGLGHSACFVRAALFWGFSPTVCPPRGFNCAVLGPSQEPNCPAAPGSGWPCPVPNRLHEAEEGAEPLLSAFSFQRLLSNLTALRLRVRPGPGRGGRLHKTSPWPPNRGGDGDTGAASGSQGREGL